MPFQEMNDYITGNLGIDVAAYLDPKVANFPNVAGYYAATGYFNEATIQCVMFDCINAWIANNENPNHYLVRAEVTYPGLVNRADLWITYNGGGGPQNIALELKADFLAESVNQDIEILDAAAGLAPPSFDEGYACYAVQVGDANWTNAIDDPIEPTVHRVPINLIF